MAHYLEHMLFKGTTKMGTIDYEKEKVHLDKITALYDQLAQTNDKEERLEIQKKINEESKLASEYALPNEFDRIIAEMGGTKLNAFTSQDMTAYINVLPPTEVEKWLEVYVHRFEEPVFRLFQSELETVYEEKNRMLNSPINYLILQFQANLFKGHPYGDKTVLGKTEHLKNPSLSAMYDYFHKYYVANNMALILVGDFNSEEVIPIIKEKAGRLPKSDLKKNDNFNIDPLVGRKEVTLKSSPVKMAVYGYRVKGQKDINQAKIDLLLALLSNDAETGLIDKLRTEGKVMEAQVFDFIQEDQGAVAVLNVPKLVGQSFEKAEEELFKQLDSLKQGNFSDELFNSVKNELIKSKKLEAEDNDYMAYNIMENFIAVNDWNKFINYENELNKLTKQDLVDYANEVFGDDYVVLFSKMGKTKMEKLEKPPFSPVIPKSNKKSEYYKVLDKIEEKIEAVSYVDFNNDVQNYKLKNGALLTTTHNPKNNIFDLNLKWKIGTYALPQSQPLSVYLNYVGTEQHPFDEFRRKMQALNVSYYFSVDEQYFTLYIDGEDELLPQTLELVNEFLLQPAKDETKIKKLVQEAKSDSKFQKSEPAQIARIEREYALYKEDSKYLTKLPTKEIKKITAEQHVNLLHRIINEIPMRITYVGNNTKVEEELNKYFNKKPEYQGLGNGKDYLKKEPKHAPQNTIYFINDKSATQTTIYFDIDLSNIPQKEHYKLHAFNEYFGAGMSSIVFQEIREFRSLAYSAWGFARIGKTPEAHETFIGYIGCQNDKTIEALTTMLNLLDSMPQKPERIDYVKKAIIKSAITARPGFRNIIDRIDTWKQQGYTQDPNYLFREEYKNLTFDDILDFYNTYLKGKPVTISIVGDKKRLGFKELSKFGEIKELKIKDVYVD